MPNKRSQKAELIDLGSSAYTPSEYRECLFQLDKIGRVLGGDRATFGALKKLSYTPESIVDVGCGSGLFTIRLAARYPNAVVVGTDISQEAISIAQENLTHVQPSLPFLRFHVPPSVHHFEASDQFDVVTATLMTHHLSDQELIAFLKQACMKAKRTVILNDLHRHWLATAGFAALAKIFFRNRLIWHDGLLSIQRAFTRRDWWSYLEAAEIDKKACTVSWHWAFRWIVTIDVSLAKKAINES